MGDNTSGHYHLKLINIDPNVLHKVHNHTQTMPGEGERMTQTEGRHRHTHTHTVTVWVRTHYYTLLESNQKVKYIHFRHIHIQYMWMDGYIRNCLQGMTD